MSDDTKCTVDPVTRTPWSLGSMVSGSAREDEWLRRHRPGTADGSAHAEGERDPRPDVARAVREHLERHGVRVEHGLHGTNTQGPEE